MMTSKLSTLGYALLGLVHGEPRTGYAIMKIFRTTPMGHYSGSPGAIYPALRASQSVNSGSQGPRPQRPSLKMLLRLSAWK